jgi:anti-sigma regulatory factor (Ser/Thr protein kinase)
LEDNHRELREQIESFVDLRTARAHLAESMRGAGAQSLEIGDAELVLTELASNSLRYSGEPVEFCLEWLDGSPVLHVWDCGDAFDWTPPRQEAASESGRGLFLVQAIAQHFSVERADERNHARAALRPLRSPA